MILNIVILIVGVLLGAYFAWNSTTKSLIPFKLVLSFAGSYLFSVTLIHIIPELFEMGGHNHHGEGVEPQILGAAMLLGFFVQKILEFFSQGVEHGHIHAHHQFNPFLLTLALCVHSFFEGTILSPGYEAMCHHSHGSSLLLGIMMHKIPAAFVLFVVLKESGLNLKKIVPYIILFALSSPIGLLFNTYVIDPSYLEGKMFLLLYALVAGSFLDISTTIFLESNPEHRVPKKKLFSILFGVALAFLTQWV